MQPNSDCLVEDKFDEDDQDNYSEITDDFLYQIDSSSPDPTIDMHLNDFSMQENNDEQMSTLHDYNFDVDIEGEPVRILSSSPHEGTYKEGEWNDHPSIVDSLRCKSIEDPSRAQLHNHCMVDNNLGQYSSHTDFNSNLDHILTKEENVENNMTPFEDK